MFRLELDALRAQAVALEVRPLHSGRLVRVSCLGLRLHMNKQQKP